MLGADFTKLSDAASHEKRYLLIYFFKLWYLSFWHSSSVGLLAFLSLGNQWIKTHPLPQNQREKSQNEL